MKKKTESEKREEEIAGLRKDAAAILTQPSRVSLKTRRAELSDEFNAIIDRSDDEHRTLTEEESDRLDVLEAEMASVDDEIKSLEHLVEEKPADYTAMTSDDRRARRVELCNEYDLICDKAQLELRSLTPQEGERTGAILVEIEQIDKAESLAPAAEALQEPMSSPAPVEVAAAPESAETQKEVNAFFDGYKTPTIDSPPREESPRRRFPAVERDGQLDMFGSALDKIGGSAGEMKLELTIKGSGKLILFEGITLPRNMVVEFLKLAVKHPKVIEKIEGHCGLQTIESAPMEQLFERPVSEAEKSAPEAVGPLNVEEMQSDPLDSAPKKKNKSGKGKRGRPRKAKTAEVEGEETGTIAPQLSGAAPEGEGVANEAAASGIDLSGASAGLF